MADPFPVSQPLRTGGLSLRKATRFALAPDAAARDDVARLLGIAAIPRLAFTGAIRPLGRTDFLLEGQLRATVVQPCVITLEPVTTEIDGPVIRRYVADFIEAGEDEAEIPADDTVEPLTDVIDPGQVMFEALALALPDYPRVPNAELPETVHAPPGVAALRDGDLRPFAGLASLARKLSDDENGNGAP
jgi:uncharacterized metal-binding protein YceD (DUF177 family)